MTRMRGCSLIPVINRDVVYFPARHLSSQTELYRRTVSTRTTT